MICMLLWVPQVSKIIAKSTTNTVNYDALMISFMIFMFFLASGEKMCGWGIWIQVLLVTDSGRQSLDPVLKLVLVTSCNTSMLSSQQ